MPSGISNHALSSETRDSTGYGIGVDEPAFTILRKEGLAMTLPMLHINHANGVGDEDTRENGTARMTPRNGDAAGARKSDLCTRRRISRSNDHLVLASLQGHQTNPLRKKPQSKSHDDLVENSDENRRRAEVFSNNVNGKSVAMTLSTEDFNEVLNAKLRKIQEREDEVANGGRKGCKKSLNFGRKPFITTVKSGEFLMPPPEVAALLGMAPNGAWIGVVGDQQDGNENEAGPTRSRFRSLLSLGRRPEVRHSSHNARCQAALKATVDFTRNLVNYATANTDTATTTTNAGGAALSNDGRARGVNRFANAET